RYTTHLLIVYIYQTTPHCFSSSTHPLSPFHITTEKSSNNTLQRVYSYIYSNHYTCITCNEQFSAATPYYGTHDSLLQQRHGLSTANLYITQTLLSIAHVAPYYGTRCNSRTSSLTATRFIEH